MQQHPLSFQQKALENGVDTQLIILPIRFHHPDRADSLTVKG